MLSGTHTSGDGGKCTKSIRSHQKRKREHVQLHLKQFFTAVPKMTSGEDTIAAPQLEDHVCSPLLESKAQEKCSKSNDSSKNAWKSIFKKIEPPLCSGHGEHCVTREVKKNGSNKGRLFFVCNRADGPPPIGRCGFFKWRTDRKLR